MKTSSTLLRSLRLTPLAACLAVACMGHAPEVSGAEHAVAAQKFNMSGHRPRLQRAPRSLIGPILSATDPVTNCLDDGSPGSLRSVIAAAGSGDTIDLSGLSCSTITLTSGALNVSVTPLTLLGPAIVPPATGPSLTIDGNSNGRVIKSSGSLTIQQLGIANGSLSVVDGRAPGGCIYVNTDVSVIDSTVSGCSAAGAKPIGGGVYSFYGDVSITRSSITGNTVTAETTSTSVTSIQATAAGVYSYASMEITDSTVSGNDAVVGTIASPTATAYSFGGGIFLFPSYGTLAISGSTISGNTAYFAGGVYAGGYTTISNSTVSGNTAYINGGGVRALNAYDLTIQNSTVAFNDAYSTGGVETSIADGATTTISSTIIANNTGTSPDYAADLGSFYGMNVAGANSLITSSDAVITFDNAPLTSDPKLLPLADNGGPTQTHLLDVGSPAIDAGNNDAALTNDQRGDGFPRTQGAATDIGAVEVAPPITDRIFADGFEGPI